MEVNCDIMKVDWRGWVIWSENYVTVLFFNVADEIVL